MAFIEAVVESPASQNEGGPIAAIDEAKTNEASKMRKGKLILAMNIDASGRKQTHRLFRSRRDMATDILSTSGIFKSLSPCTYCTVQYVPVHTVHYLASAADVVPPYSYFSSIYGGPTLVESEKSKLQGGIVFISYQPCVYALAAGFGVVL